MQKTAVIFDGKITMYLNHGHDTDALAGSIPNGCVLICGHTHVPAARKDGGHWYLNPGSVSIPKENSEHGYMIYEDGVFEWKNFDGETYNKLQII